MNIRSLLIALLLLPAAPLFASTWDIDPVHTSAQFAVKHLMVSTVRGTMGKVTGIVELDDKDPTKSKVDASVDVAGLDTREPKRDEHLKSPDFFDAARFPMITFKSKSASQVGDKYKVVGDLTMHGITKEVTLDVEGSPTPTKDPWGNAKLGGVAHTVVNRQDFGMAFNKLLETGGMVVANEVEVTIDIELTKRK